jgi:hypothetical protein
MLTRGAGQGNPYKPGAFDPAGMMVAPLALIGFVLGKKRKRGKWDTFIAVLFVCVVVGMSVSACSKPSTSEPTADPQKTIEAQVTVLVEATKNAGATETALAVTVDGVTATAIFAPSGTPEPACPEIIPTTGIELNPDTETDFFTPVPDRKEAFLQAVLRHQSELPKGMSVPLLLAMGAAESGEYTEWNQEKLNGGGIGSSGILQVDNLDYKWKSGTPPWHYYNNSATGFDNNVRDAISFLNDLAVNSATGKGHKLVEETFSNLPSGDSIKLLIYYNGGAYDPIGTYRIDLGNPYYLTKVAYYLEEGPDFSFACQYADPQLAQDLRRGQEKLLELLE